MAFLQATATSIQDLFDDLSTFLVANTWTDRALTPSSGRKGFAHTGAPDQIEVQFRWDTGTPQFVGVYQSTGFTSAATDPGSHTNDSGQGVVSGTNATIGTGRNVKLVNGSMPYWFFEKHSGDYYCHVAVQVAAGPPQQIYHFGFGCLRKFGTWTGGAYSYGMNLPAASTATMPDGTILLDGLAIIGSASQRAFVGSLHAEGLQNMAGSTKWCLVWADSGAQSTDRAGNARNFVQGWFRGGPVARFFARPAAQSLDGLVPTYPGGPLFYRDLVPATDELFPLGMQPDVVGVNIQNFAVGDQVYDNETGNTYVVFPGWRNLTTGSNDTDYLGVGYLLVP